MWCLSVQDTVRRRTVLPFSCHTFGSPGFKFGTEVDGVLVRVRSMDWRVSRALTKEDTFDSRVYKWNLYFVSSQGIYELRLSVTNITSFFPSVVDTP